MREGIAAMIIEEATAPMAPEQIEVIYERWYARQLWDDDVPNLIAEIKRLQRELRIADDKIAFLGRQVANRSL